MPHDEKPADGYASPPCLAHEIDPAYFDPLGVTPQQAQDVARWRKAERARLLAERAALSVDTRKAAAISIAEHLDSLLAQRSIGINGLTISAWWPIKAEIDLRFWLAGLAARGARAALPLVETKAAPLIFREWTPDTRMERGIWNIPVPAEGPDILPDITLSPVVGWDRNGYRLGYGGDYTTPFGNWGRTQHLGNCNNFSPATRHSHAGHCDRNRPSRPKTGLIGRSQKVLLPLGSLTEVNSKHV
ncbi:5-formyltetrahydrofolate cyclo-ligase [Falsihalocynthiibacter sp. S25ZX9]|uniref:5-formyltetrahydrofolate cyclo-ligase n=1 Tax=Falsihalocynthiibacter sp. S25ZX9 TaxID=3240870 RepID=UPI00350EEFC9